MKKTIITILIVLVILAIGITIGLNADKIWEPKYEGLILTNVEMKENLKDKLVQRAYTYLDKKGLIEEFGIDKNDTVTIKKDDDYNPIFMGSLTSTWRTIKLKVYVVDFKKGNPVIISQSTEEVIGQQIAIMD